jgi:sugar phosphate isomerase/epimerase
MNRSLSRRSFLQVAAAGTAGTALRPVPIFGGAGASPSPTVALQGYSLKEFNLPHLLGVAGDLGLDHLVLFDDQLSVFLSERGRVRARETLDAAGISVPATYTGHFSPDEAATRTIFEFGRQMGLQFFSCTPGEETLRLLNRLVPEYEVGIALHNPGPGPDESFVELEAVATTLERYPNIGACVDIGNFARAGVDPVRALQRLAGRIHELHVKDVAADGSYTVLGEGVIDLDAVFVQLRDMTFEGLLTLEYGAHPDDVDARIADIRTNLDRLRSRAR